MLPMRPQEEYALERKMHMLDRLAWSEMFENFLANKFTAAKRFGLEGAETLIPGMKALIDLSAEHGTESICIGMPHRGTTRRFCLFWFQCGEKDGGKRREDRMHADRR